MTYPEAVAYLFSLQKHGIKLGLETMAALMERLDGPHSRFRSLHIAGTNGKGSTAAMAAAILQAAGYRVGLYTSPHLVDFRERIRINGAMISEADVARLAAAVRESCGSDLLATFFEQTTAMAFQHFADEAVDVAVLEVGLGGRFDATNVVMPMACAITTIALDHQEYLGDRLESIAFEKAGIIKRGIPVTMGAVEGEAARTIVQVAAERGAPLRRLHQEFGIVGGEESFTYRGQDRVVERLRCRLTGRHQLDNAACAIAMIEAAAPHGLIVTEGAIRTGLRDVAWEGRLEVADERPMILLDGAHNPAGASALASSLRLLHERRRNARIILVLGMMRDKDHTGFIGPLKVLADQVILTQADVPRSATAADLLNEIGQLTSKPLVTSSSGDALALARQLAGVDDIICVTGSLMVIGEVKALLRGCRLSPLRG